MEKERDNTTKHSSTRRGIATSQLIRYSGTDRRGEVRGGLCPLIHHLKYVIESKGLVRWTYEPKSKPSLKGYIGSYLHIYFPT